MTLTIRLSFLGVCLVAGAGLVAAQGCGGSSGAGSEAGPPGGIDGSSTAIGSGGVAGGGGSVSTGGRGAGGAAGTTTTPGVGGSVATGGVGPGGGDGGVLGGAGGSTVPVCGQPGYQCCDGNGCDDGGCCVTGICMAAGGTCVRLGGGVCSSGACGSCGGAGMPCCGADPANGECTAPNTVCSSGRCTKCGDLGTPCCASTTGGAGKCNANAVCSGGSCLACGTPGTACCPGNVCNSPGCCYDSFCYDQGAGCGASGGTCQAGRCSGCGSATEPCCAGLCYDGLLCKSGTCTPCGAVNQACCPAGTDAAVCQAGTLCTGVDGGCARCGGLGDICCAGNACTDGCCVDGRCLASSVCAGAPDGGQPDAPLGGSGGNPGTGGTGGAGGTTVVGTGGAGGTTTVPTGGAGGTTTPWTVPAGCGDGQVTPPERCDDGNTVPFDGCSSDCQWEPDCSAGACTSKCGDGIVLGEECDDGNTADGDGCSSSCKVETGFTCAQPPLGDRILVPAVYRDFKFHNPTDFEAGITGVNKASTGMVELDLDAEGKPVYANLPEPPANVHVASATTFATWYRNSDTVNHATPSKLALWDNHNGAYVNRYGANGEQWALTQTANWCGSVGSEALDGSGNPIPCTYKYSSSTAQTDCDKLAGQGLTMLKCSLDSTGSTYRGIFLQAYVDGNPLFFPVDGDPFSASELRYAQIPSDPAGMYDASGTWPHDVDANGKDILHNFSFTSEIRYWFKYEAGQSYTLDVVGDDDVWVFINKKLAVDLGGIHTPVAGSVTLNGTTAPSYGLEAGKVYEVAVFQAERQSTSSTFKLTLAGFNLAPSECHPS